MIEDDKLLREHPLYLDRDTITGYRLDLVITKEEFLECYNAWVKGGEQS